MTGTTVTLALPRSSHLAGTCAPALEPCNVALFTHRFLEPTHHAIAQVLAALGGYRFTAFAKHLLTPLPRSIPNLAGTHVYRKGRCPELETGGFALALAIYDGKTALRASEAAAAAGLPLLLSFHGGFDTQAKIFDPRYREWTRSVVERAAAVTVVCDADAQRLRAIGVRRELEVIPVVVDCAGLPVRAEVETGTLLAVGRLVPKKGIDLAVRAMTLLPAHYRLRIIGEGECGPDLRELASRLGVDGRVTWLGLLPLEQTLAELSRCEALLHPARVAADQNAEGTPQIVLSAQALGVPVVTTATGSLPEIVRDGDNGVVVPAEDPAAVAAGVERVAGDAALRRKLREAAAGVRARHDLPAVCALWEAILQRVAHGPAIR